MSYAPIARIFLRYVVGGVVAPDVGDLLAGDPDVVTVVALGVGASVEGAYAFAKSRGWAT